MFTLSSEKFISLSFVRLLRNLLDNLRHSKKPLTDCYLWIKHGILHEYIQAKLHFYKTYFIRQISLQSIEK